MKTEYIVGAVLIYLAAHYLLAQPNLNPNVRKALHVIENEELTKLMVEVFA